MKVSIVSGDFAGGQRKSGVEKGPSCLLEEGQLVKRLSVFSEVKVIPSIGLHELGTKIMATTTATTVPNNLLTDHSEDISIIQKIYQPELVSEATRKLYQVTCEERSLSSPDMVITLGGDHSISIGSVLATAQAYPEFCVIWVDAHADINTPDTTPSGNIHGMPLGFLCNIDNCVESTPEFHWMLHQFPSRKGESSLSNKETSIIDDRGVVTKGNSGCLDETRLAYIGLRDVDEGEAEILKRGGPIVFTTQDVTLRGIQDVMKSILDQLPSHLPIHLSFDIDALDPNYAPSTGTRVHDGLHLDDALHITRTLGKTGRLVALDLVEVNPDLCLNNPKEDRATTIASALAIIQSAVETTSLTKSVV
jgi:arginase